MVFVTLQTLKILSNNDNDNDNNNNNNTSLQLYYRPIRKLKKECIKINTRNRIRNIWKNARRGRTKGQAKDWIRQADTGIGKKRPDF